MTAAQPIIDGPIYVMLYINDGTNVNSYTNTPEIVEDSVLIAHDKNNPKIKKMILTNALLVFKIGLVNMPIKAHAPYPNK